MRTPTTLRQAVLVVVLAALAGGNIGCEGKARRAATQPSVTSRPLSRVVELGPQTLNFTPTREDVTVGRAVVAVASSHRPLVNGIELDRWDYIYLKRLGRNRFELPALRIEFAPAAPAAPDASDAIGCVSVKVWFNEVTTYSDSDLYEERDDRYALLSWCTTPPEMSKDTSYKARFGQNRVQTLTEFRKKLAKPFPIRLNPTPLRSDWGYPKTKGGPRELSEAELNAVKQIMRDRGEQYLISIIGRDATHAEVDASIGDMTGYQGTRRYTLALRQGTWQVERVVEEPNMSRLVQR